MSKKEEPAPPMTMAELRTQKQLAVRAELNKKYGAQASGKASDRIITYTPRISSSSFQLDFALGGGWPRGRINLIWGSYSSGKTSTFLRTLADAQRRDVLTNRYFAWMSPEERANAIPMSCGWIDAEGSFDRSWAMKMGVDLDKLEYCCPNSQEEAADTAEKWILAGYDCVFLDSIASMTPTKEIEGDMGDRHMGVAARGNNQMFRKIQAALNRRAREDVMTVPTFFVVNQERATMAQYGPSIIKPGGWGQEFYTSVILHLKGNSVEYYDEKERTLPKLAETKFRVDKNKSHPPQIVGRMKTALVDDPNDLFCAGEVIDQAEVMEMAKNLQIYERVSATSWKMFGKTYKRKTDIHDEWIVNKEKYKILKGVLLTKLYPHQANDWKLNVAQKTTKASESVSEVTKAG